MHAALEYIALGIIAILIVTVSLGLSQIVFNNVVTVKEEQLYTVAQRVMDKIILTPGNPVDWGANFVTNITDFGLSLYGANEPYIVDPDKIMRLVNYTWFKNPTYLNPEYVQSLLGLNSTDEKYGFSLEIQPLYTLEVSPNIPTGYYGDLEASARVFGNYTAGLRIEFEASNSGRAGSVVWDRGSRVRLSILLVSRTGVGGLAAGGGTILLENGEVYVQVVIDGRLMFSGYTDNINATFYEDSLIVKGYLYIEEGRYTVRVNGTIIDSYGSGSTRYSGWVVFFTSSTNVDVSWGNNNIYISSRDADIDIPSKYIIHGIPAIYTIYAENYYGVPVSNVNVTGLLIITYLEGPSAGCSVGRTSPDTINYKVLAASNITLMDGRTTLNFTEQLLSLDPPKNLNKMAYVLIIYGDWYGSRATSHWVKSDYGVTLYLIGRYIIASYEDTIPPFGAVLLKDEALEAIPDYEKLIEIQSVTVECVGDDPGDWTPACRVLNKGSKSYQLYRLSSVERLASHVILLGCKNGRLRAFVAAKYPVETLEYGMEKEQRAANEVVITRIIHVMDYAYVIRLNIWRWSEL